MVTFRRHVVPTPLQAYRLISIVWMLCMLALIWLPPVPGGFHARLQGVVYDSLLPRSQLAPDARVVIVDINDASLAAIGRWPWPREVMAELVARIRAAGAVLVGVDVLFPESDSQVADTALAKQLAQEDVVGAVAFGFAAGVAVRQGDLWPLATAQIGLAPALQQADVGHITPLHDPDHVIRRLYPVICEERCIPTLALAMLQRWSDMTWHLEPGGIGQPDRVCVASFCLSLNSDGTVSIPYHHLPPLQSVAAADVLQQAPPLPLDGAMVIVGTSAVGLGDLVATPLSATTPGVLIHAALLTAALDSVTWVELPGASWWLTLLVWLVWLVAWPGLARDRWGWLAAAAVALLVGAVTSGLPRLGYWVQPLPAWGAMAGGVLLLGMWQAGELLRQRRWLYRAFAAYVPHEVIKTMVRNQLQPGQLDAQRVDATVLFADIRGFTRLSEQLEPEQLVALTNRLFTAISEEVHRHKGTLDKFMGDAVMAFWGAPLPLPDHAEWALRCAAAIQSRLESMQTELERNGFPPIVMTIALESGPVAVGNFGSRQRRAYTVMGKTVNLAAHLQPMCAELEVDILCGPALCQSLPDKIEQIGVVAIRGIEGEQIVGTPIKKSPVD